MSFFARTRRGESIARRIGGLLRPSCFLEGENYVPGQDRTVVEFRGWKFLLQICYDLRFPVFSRNNPDDAYDAIIYVANWPKPRIHAWRTLLQARAIENSSYVIGVNRVGLDGNNINYNGKSRIFNYKGERMDNFSINQPQIEVHNFDKNQLMKYRKKFPVLKDADRFSLHL